MGRLLRGAVSSAIRRYQGRLSNHELARRTTLPIIQIAPSRFHTRGQGLLQSGDKFPSALRDRAKAAGQVCTLPIKTVSPSTLTRPNGALPR